jgi:hypothetical protein
MTLALTACGGETPPNTGPAPDASSGTDTAPMAVETGTGSQESENDLPEGWIATDTNIDLGNRANLGIGDTALIAPNVYMTINHVWTSQGGENEFLQPRDEFVNVNVTIRNESDNDFTVVEMFETAVYDSRGDSHLISMRSDETATSLESPTPPGQSRTGDITFDIPTNATGLVFTYHDVFHIFAPVTWQIDR